MRSVLVIGSIFLIFSLFTLLSSQRGNSPIITDINPAVGEPGDIMTIEGNFFGPQTIGSSVEIGGFRLTRSSYLLWEDTMIKVVLPQNISDGLVYVETKNGKSNPSVFANRETIPIPLTHSLRNAMPVIQTITAPSNRVGSVITIDGQNFGAIRESSEVLFTLNQGSGSTRRELIACSPFDKDYQFWSDTQLQVRIPEGAQSGSVYIRTANGLSSGFNLTIAPGIGTKMHRNFRSYVVGINSDVSELQAQEHATLTLFMPYPTTSLSQRSVEVLSSEPEPQLSYENIFVHQISQSTNGRQKLDFSHTFAVDVYEINTSININSIRPYFAETLVYYNDFLIANAIVPSDDENLIELVTDIVGRETNAWRKAKLLYDWMIDEVRIVQSLRSADSPILEALEDNRADAYEMAVLYTAFLRAAGIPAVTNSGILVDANVETKNHWWTEFYVEDFGWVPVDTALAAGLEYEPFEERENPEEFYFGNLDAQHIVFSRGLNTLSQMQQATGKKVYRPKTYALQAIWEESTDGVLSYSSYWPNATVIGIY